jgi:hypothetical protein
MEPLGMTTFSAKWWAHGAILFYRLYCLILVTPQSPPLPVLGLLVTCDECRVYHEKDEVTGQQQWSCEGVLWRDSWLPLLMRAEGSRRGWRWVVVSDSSWLMIELVASILMPTCREIDLRFNVVAIGSAVMLSLDVASANAESIRVRHILFWWHSWSIDTIISTF